MKKILLLSSVLLSTFAPVKAQITVTSSDIAGYWMVIHQVNDTAPTISAGASGASQTWNMSALHNHYVDTLGFVPYSFQPNSKFSSANLVIKINTNGTFVYATNTASAFSILGDHATANIGGTPVVLDQVNSPAEKLVGFPDTYNSSYTNDYTSKATFFYGASGVDSIRITSVVHKTELTDAWGSLLTPLGTYNVLRDKETKISNNTVEGYITGPGWTLFNSSADSTTTYGFWANTIGFPIASLTMDSTGAVKSAQWLLSAPSAGIHEYAAAEVNVYPNPAQYEIYFDLDPALVAVVKVYDIAGREVVSEKVTSNSVAIATGALPNGCYTYSVIGHDQLIAGRGRFIVSK